MGRRESRIQRIFTRKRFQCGKSGPTARKKTAAPSIPRTAAVVGLRSRPARTPAGRDYSALTMFSTIFLASPNSIIVLSS